MFRNRWSGPACRKPLVTIRYHPPWSATAGPSSPPSLISLPPPSSEAAPPPPPISARNTITLSAINAYVPYGVPDRRSGRVRARVRCPAHSGQRIPTGESYMQSGQIGRPQREHLTFVSRFGCL